MSLKSLLATPANACDTEDDHIEAPTIYCPKMTGCGVPVDTPSMTESSCKLRIELKNKCTIGCAAVDYLRVDRGRTRS